MSKIFYITTLIIVLVITGMICLWIYKNLDKDTKIKKVYIQENDKYIPYLLINRNDNIFLIRKDVVKIMPFNELNSVYENSYIDKYLSEEFIKVFPISIQEKLTYTDIEVTTETSLCSNIRQKYTIPRKIFIPSYEEVGCISNMNAVNEGKTFDIFCNNNSRIAYFYKAACSWWLRTPHTEYNSVIWCINIDGAKTEYNCSVENGVRPVLCFDSAVTNIKYYEEKGFFIIE